MATLGLEARAVLLCERKVLRNLNTVPLKCGLACGSPVYEKTIVAPPSETYFQSCGKVSVALRGEHPVVISQLEVVELENGNVQDGLMLPRNQLDSTLSLTATLSGSAGLTGVFYSWNTDNTSNN